MRIIRLKLDKDVKKLLRHYARDFAIDDPGWVEDMFALFRLKGSGLPSKDRIAKMAKAAVKRRKIATNEVSISMLITKRKMMMASFISTPYFHALLALSDTTEAVNRYLANMKKLYLKSRQAQCLTCTFLKQCDFGKQYSAHFTDVTKVIDPDFSKKAHKDCPILPEIEGFNQMVASHKQYMQTVQAAQNPSQAALIQSVGGASLDALGDQADELDEADPDIMEDESTDEETLQDSDEPQADYYIAGGQPCKSGGGNVFDGRLDGESLCKVSEKLIDDMSILQLQIFELGKKFSQELTAQKAGKFKPVPQIEHDKAAIQIEKESDLPQITPSQHGLPTEVFDARLEKKELQKTQYKKPEDKKKLLYLLVDVSGSMTAFLGDGKSTKHGLFMRHTLATLFSVAVTKRVRDDKGIVYLRFFASAPSQLKSARTPDEFEALLTYLTLPSGRSGGTDISAAIKKAVADIAAAKDELHSAEILMITDAEDTVNEASIKAMLGKTELNILDVAGGATTAWAAQSLKAVASKYYKANEAEPDISKIVSIV